MPFKGCPVGNMHGIEDIDLIATLALCISLGIDAAATAVSDNPEVHLVQALSTRFAGCQSECACWWRAMTDTDRRASVLRMVTLLKCNMVLWDDGEPRVWLGRCAIHLPP